MYQKGVTARGLLSRISEALSSEPFDGVPLNTAIHPTAEEINTSYLAAGTQEVIGKSDHQAGTWFPASHSRPTQSDHPGMGWGPRICILKGPQKSLFSTSSRATAKSEQVSSSNPRADVGIHVGHQPSSNVLQLSVSAAYVFCKNEHAPATGTWYIIKMCFPSSHVVKTPFPTRPPHISRGAGSRSKTLGTSARSSPGALVAPPRREGAGKPARSPKSPFRWKRPGILPDSTWRPPRGLPRPPSGCVPQTSGPGGQGHWATAQTEKRPGPKPQVRHSPPSPRRRSWSPGLAAWPGPRPHSPTNAREAGHPLLGSAHPRTATANANAAYFLGVKKKRKTRKRK